MHTLYYLIKWSCFYASTFILALFFDIRCFFLSVSVARGFLRGLSCHCFCTVLFLVSVQHFLWFVMPFILIKLFFCFFKKIIIIRAKAGPLAREPV